MSFVIRWPQLSGKIYYIAFGLVLAGAAYIRFWAAPLSAGVDVPQFWAFADLFKRHGLDFYRYSDGTLYTLPTPGWGFVYPPVWLLILGLALVATPLSTANSSMVDATWRLAMKTPIIAADLAIGCLLFWAVPGPKWRKLIFATLWLFHPTAWYNSAVFGQFDAIAAVLLLATLIMLERGKDRIAFVLAALAVLTKQHTLIPIIFMIAISARNMGWRRLFSNCAISIGVVLLFSIPFLVTGNIGPYASSVFFPGQGAFYQNPLLYSFSGSGSLLTYLYNVFGWETSGFFNINFPIMGLAILVALFFSYKRCITLAQGALVGFLIFLSFSYRVNYQYLIIYIPIALLVAAQTKHLGERIFTLVLALLPAVWLWLFDVSFWFTHLDPTNYWVVAILERIGLTHRGLPDYAFVILALVLMCLFLVYVVLALTRWRQRPDKIKTVSTASLRSLHKRL